MGKDKSAKKAARPEEDGEKTLAVGEVSGL